MSRVASDLAVIVVAHDSERWLQSCLQSVEQTLGVVPHPVVVDNASTDASVNLVTRQFPRVRVIASPVNSGFAGGANLGLRNTSEDLVVILNPDVTVRESTFAALVAAFASDPRIAIAGGKLLYPGSKIIQHAGGEITYPLALANHFGYAQPDSDRYGGERDVDYVTGGLIAIRRSALDRVGLFDEGFFPAYFEEADLCYRARQAGYRVAYAPSAVAIHHETATLGKESPRYYHYYHRNRVRYVLKHYTGEQLERDFLAAEIARLAAVGRSDEAEALHQAYQDNLDVLLGSEAMFARPAGAARLPADESRLRVTWILQAAARRLLSSESKRGVEMNLVERLGHVQYLSELRRRQVVAEKPFVSSVPILGPWVVRLRRAWNWMSTTWYVRPMTQQQNEFNELVADTFSDLSQDLTKLTATLARVKLTGELTVDSSMSTEHQVAALSRDLKRLETRLANLERQIVAASAPLDSPSGGASLNR